MGGEFYADPYQWHQHWLLDKKTYKLVKSIDRKRIKVRKNPLKWHKTVQDFITYRRCEKENRLAYQRKLKTISRIDYLITTEHDAFEVDRIRQLYPNLRAEYRYGVFNQNLDRAIGISASPLQDEYSSVSILLGNSSDMSNNHLDAFSHIQQSLSNKYNLYCPLSYGNDEYKQIVVKKLNKSLGDRFHNIDYFLPIEEYLDFLNQMDVMIMYHNRQQAMGNIVMAIALGKPVFMKLNNPIYSLLSSQGISIFNVEDLSWNSMIKAIRSSRVHREISIQKLKSLFSEETRLKHLSKLIAV